MKRILFAVMLVLLVCSEVWADVEIDEGNFPDEVFREYVRSHFDKDSDDVLSEAEIARAKHIRVGLFIRPLLW